MVWEDGETGVTGRQALYAKMTEGRLAYPGPSRALVVVSRRLPPPRVCLGQLSPGH